LRKSSALSLEGSSIPWTLPSEKSFTKDGGVVVKLRPKTVKALLKARTASWLVMGKRTMKEWVVIRYQDASDARKHLSLLKEAMDYVAEMAQG